MKDLTDIVYCHRTYWPKEWEGQIYFLPNIEFNHTSWNARHLYIAWLIFMIDIDINKFMRTFFNKK